MIVEDIEKPCNTCTHEERCNIQHPELEIPEEEKIQSCDILNKFSGYSQNRRIVF